MNTGNTTSTSQDRNPTATMDTTPETSAEFLEIKKILEPLRAIFTRILSQSNIIMKYHYVCVDDAEHKASGKPIKYTAYMQDTDLRTTVPGRIILWSELPLKEQIGFLKLDYCVTTISIFSKQIEQLLTTIGAQAQWTFLDMQPATLYRIGEDTREYEDPLHCAFIVRSRSGMELIADFTIEQYGYDDDCWLSTSENYMTRYAHPDQRRSERAMADREFLEDFAQRNNRVTGICLIIYEICEQIDWETYHGLPEEERFAWLYGCVDGLADLSRESIIRSYETTRLT